MRLVAGYGSMPVTLEIPRPSCWHHSLSLSFSFTESTSIKYGESRDSTSAIQSRGKGLSTFKKSPIHFCNHRAYNQQRSGAHSWSSWPRQACTRVVIFYSPAMAFLTVTYIAPLHDDWRYRDLESFWIVDSRTKILSDQNICDGNDDKIHLSHIAILLYL